MTDELLPCPFCGGDAELDTGRCYRALDTGRIGASVAVYCRGCTADVGMCKEDFPEMSVEQLTDIVREAWNARAQPSPAAGEVLAAEFAFKAGEKGWNWERTQAELRKLLTAAPTEAELDLPAFLIPRAAPATAAELYPGRYTPGCVQCAGMGCAACALP